MPGLPELSDNLPPDLPEKKFSHDALHLRE